MEPLAVKEIHMTPGKKVLAFAMLFACGMSSQAFAQQKGCIELKSTAQIEQEVVDAKGVKTKQLVEVTKVVPGAEVVWTVTASNICKQTSDAVTINNFVPEHFTYVANSATGPGADIAYSVDGKTFAKSGEVTVLESGASRKARTDEFKHIRWSFKDSLQPGASTFASFRAVLN
jgi:uncharacterized repeat protein (TIGR01451 family)